MFLLRVTPPEGPSFERRLGPGELVVGRAPECDLSLAADASLSRRHARLRHDGEHLWVEDLGSSNGTRVNGVRIAEPTPLAPGDVVLLSSTRIAVSAPAAEEVAAGGPRGQDVRSGLGADGDGEGVGDGNEDGGGELTLLRPVSELLAEELAAGLGEEEAGEGEAGEGEAGDAKRAAAVAAGGAGEDAAAEAGAQRSGAARRHAARLKLLNELHRELGRSISLGEALEGVLDGIFRHLEAEEAAIYLAVEPPPGTAAEAAAAGGGEAPDERPLQVAAARPAGEPPRLVSRTLRREVMGKGQAALAVDAQMDQRFAGAESIVAAGVHSLIAAPLLDAEGCLGMVVLSSRVHVHTFDEDDLELLASIAYAAALRIRNLRLARQAAEQERLESELRTARRIQVSLLPKRIPQPAGYRLYAANTPSRAVSGDYYQVLQRPGAGGGDGEGGGDTAGATETAVLLADVCGKGMPAALLTATLEAVCSALLEAGGSGAAVLGRVCGFLWDRTPPDKYATACLAVLQGDAGRVAFVNAGHNPPLLLRGGGEVEELGASGFPLGLVPACEYESQTLQLAPGDVLFLYTDGIVEAENPAGDEYGLERLRELCRRHREDALQELAAALEADLDAHCGDAPQGDDRTYVVIQRLAAS